MFSYIETKDPYLLNQYFELREKVYVDEFELGDFSDHQDDYDAAPSTHIILAVRKSDSKVIGGARIVIHTPGSSLKLPMESEGLLLSKLADDTDLNNHAYAEICRMCISKDYRNKVVAREIQRKLLEKCNKEWGVKYIFTLSPAAQARAFRAHFKNIGYEMKIMTDIKISAKKEHRGRRMLLTKTATFN